MIYVYLIVLLDLDIHPSSLLKTTTWTFTVWKLTFTIILIDGLRHLYEELIYKIFLKFLISIVSKSVQILYPVYTYT
ncbi:hypothetical protein BH23THE1_BH23THE1_19450 [soil metagenome]